MSDNENVRASGVESVDVRPRYFSVTMVHRLQEQVKAVHLENSRLEETVRKQQQQVKAAQGRHESLLPRDPNDAQGP
jgi:predicted nuclease with TOPRIM domain